MGAPSVPALTQYRSVPFNLALWWVTSGIEAPTAVDISYRELVDDAMAELAVRGHPISAPSTTSP
jgi:hypothetical protein